jgi:hypothetical protein
VISAHRPPVAVSLDVVAVRCISVAIGRVAIAVISGLVPVHSPLVDVGLDPVAVRCVSVAIGGGVLTLISRVVSFSGLDIAVSLDLVPTGRGSSAFLRSATAVDGGTMPTQGVYVAERIGTVHVPIRPLAADHLMLIEFSQGTDVGSWRSPAVTTHEGCLETSVVASRAPARRWVPPGDGRWFR